MSKNICKYKGSYGEKISSNYIYENSKTKGYCECYKLCKGRFLKEDSKTLRDYKKQTKSKFKGCLELERELLKEKLVRATSKCDLEADLYKDNIAKENLSQRDIWEIIIQIADGYNWDKKYLLKVLNISNKRLKSDTSSKILTKLMRTNKYENGPHLLFAALLVKLDMNDKETIEKYFPKYELNRFFANQSRVFLDIERETPRRIIVIKHLLKILSESQRDAVKKYYINNSKNLSMEEVAKRLGIKKSSLYSRLEGAKKMLKKRYEMYFRLVEFMNLEK